MSTVVFKVVNIFESKTLDTQITISLPETDLYIDNKKILSLSDVSVKPFGLQSPDNLANVIIDCDGIISELDFWARPFVDCLFKSIEWQTENNCYFFINYLLGAKKLNTGEGWYPSDIINKMEIPDYSPIDMYKNATMIHSSFHVQNGIFVSKIGFEPTYLICTMKKLAELYPDCDVRVLRVESKCEYCMKEIPSKELKKCANCKQKFYCGKICQKEDWSNHKIDCNLLGEGKEEYKKLPSVFPKVRADIVLDEFVMPERARIWLRNIFARTERGEEVPCTDLEQLNDILDINDKNYQDFITRDSEGVRFVIARLNDAAYWLILQLSAQKILGLAFVNDPAKWTGSKTYYLPKTSNEYSAIAKSQTKGTFQLSLKIVKGYNNNTGHFSISLDKNKRPKLISFIWN